LKHIKKLFQQKNKKVSKGKEKKHIESLLKQIKSGIFHHAYILENWAEEELEETIDAIKNIFGKKVDGRDIFSETQNSFGIKESRNLKEKAYSTPFGEHKLFFIKILNITKEAENALLKLFEEPPAKSLFFIFSKKLNLSKTLLSRTIKISAQVETENLLFRKIKEMTIGEKIEQAKKISDKTKEDGDKNDVIHLLNSIEEYIRKNSKMNKEISIILKEIENSKDYIKDKSAGVKMILENIFIKTHKILDK
jgi:hypothetical protein